MAKLTVHPGKSKGIINKNIYGHFSEHLGRCIYGGFFVGKDSPIPNVNGMRTDVVEAMKNIKAPVLRWPGGCFADEYHWQDGIGPQEQRKRMVNTNWGYVVEDNSFGTHEFMELCRQIGCEPYITGNVGSGTVREMAEWVEYLNSDGESSVVRGRIQNGHPKPFNVRYWAVGNENWGCGGSMTPEYYANEYRRYQTYCRNYGKNKLYRVACGPSDMDTHWTDVMMRECRNHMDGLALHRYTIDWSRKGSATQFSTGDYYYTLSLAYTMDPVIQAHSEIMDRYDPKKKVGLVVDEWGTWYDVEPGTNPGFLYQQNTMRDAMVAAINLNIFNKHCDRVTMANLAQTVNVLQSVILTDGDRMVLTPTYHVFDLFKNHQDAEELECSLETAFVGDENETMPQVTASASQKDGVLTVTAANIHPEKAEDLEIALDEQEIKKVTVRLLQGRMNAYNDFDNSPLAVEAWPDFEIRQGKVIVHLPACSVAEICVKPAE